MFKKLLKLLKEYEIVENNSQRLNKGFKPKFVINKIWGFLYE